MCALCVLGTRVLHTRWCRCALRIDVGHTCTVFSSSCGWHEDERVAVHPVAAQDRIGSPQAGPSGEACLAHDRRRRRVRRPSEAQARRGERPRVC